MQKISLDAQAREQLERAATSPGHSATTGHGSHDHTVRRTVLALTAGTSPAGQENPGQATVLLPPRRVRPVGGDTRREERTGDPIVIVPARRSPQAVAHSAVLLTVAPADR